MHPIIATRINDASLKWKPVVSLAQVTDEKETYRVRFSGSASSSAEFAKCAKVQEKNGSLTTVKDGAKKGQKLVTYIQFLAKDSANFGSNQFSRVHLIDNGNFFPGITASDLQDKAKNASVKEALELLARFNVWVEASVKLHNGQIVITDSTSLKKFD